MKKPQIKKGDYLSYLKWFWWFLWDDNSVWSWIANVVVAFVVIKFIVYPGLGFLFATSHPIVAVVSGSMEHKYAVECIDADPVTLACISKQTVLCSTIHPRKLFVSFNEYWDICGSWYENKQITKEDFKGFPLSHGFNKGDIIILLGKNPKNLKIGDIIVFQSFKTEPIIHRIIAINDTPAGRLFTTKGDHNPDSGFIDRNIAENQVIGRAYLRIPYLGYVKIWFVELLALVGYR